MPNPCVKSEDLVVLVHHARVGVQSAQEELIRRYEGRVAAFNYSMVGRKDAVPDLCHTVFLKMILHIKRLRTAESFEPWLFQIARRTCFDFLRKERLRSIFVPLEPAHEQIAAGSQPAGVGLETFLKALSELPPKQRELIALLQQEELSYEGLAEITGSTVSSVKSRLFRAREHLRRRLRNES